MIIFHTVFGTPFPFDQTSDIEIFLRVLKTKMKDEEIENESDVVSVLVGDECPHSQASFYDELGSQHACASRGCL